MSRSTWRQGAVIVAGAVYGATAVVMLAAPQWFYRAVGHFPPYNRHYLRDVAAFTLPVGAALLWAGRNLERRQSLLLLGLAASLLHVVNHAFDAIGKPAAHWLLDVGPLMLLLIALAGVCLRAEFADGPE